MLKASRSSCLFVCFSVKLTSSSNSSYKSSAHCQDRRNAAVQLDSSLISLFCRKGAMEKIPHCQLILSIHLTCCCPEDWYFISRFHLILRAIQMEKLLCLSYTTSFSALQDALLAWVDMQISGNSLQTCNMCWCVFICWNCQTSAAYGCQQIWISTSRNTGRQIFTFCLAFGSSYPGDLHMEMQVY